MTQLTLAELSKKMAKLDFATMTTLSLEGELTARPMSNNGDVEFDGDSYFFANGTSRKVAELRSDPVVLLSYTGAVGMLGGPPLFVVVEGRATLVEDKAAFSEHWTNDLNRYFSNGIDTPGIVMIRVSASAIRYWDGADEGAIAM